MSNNNKSIITKLLVFVCLILLGIVLSQFIPRENASKKKPSDDFNQVILDFAQYKADFYQKGDIEGEYFDEKLNCPQYLQKSMDVHSSFFECNPLFYLCKTEDVEKFKNYDFQFLGYEFGVHASFIVKYLVAGFAFQLKLKNNCASTFLPRNVYNAGPKENSDYLWDNSLENVYIDKNYINNLDIAIVQNQKIENLKNPHMPALNLKRDKMQEVCSLRGGQLLQSRYFDAAVNYPSLVVNKVIRKFPYPWTKRRELREEKLEAHCLKNFTKECDKKNYVYHSDYSPSWIGIYHALGSHMEYLDNKFYPPANLKVSSYLIAKEDIWNKNFLRGSNTENGDIKRYNGMNREYLEKKEWAFRCQYFK